MRRLSLLVAAALAMPGIAQAQRREAWQPPTLTTERYNEDWSDLADADKRTDHWTERLKYIPLDRNGDDYLTTGVEFRLRNEDYRNNLWGSADAPNDSYLWERLLPYADLHVGHVRAFVQPIVAYAFGVRPAAGPVDETGVDLLQGFADVDVDIGSDTNVRLRAGREMVGLGTERLVGTRYGPNVPLAYDGGRVIVHHRATTINLIYLRPVSSRPGSFNDATSDTRQLWGVYATRLFGKGGAIGVDLYYLGYQNERAHFYQGSGREVRHTIGTRFFGKSGGWRWNVEGIGQFGSFAGAPITAWSIGTEGGYTFLDAVFKPSITLRANVVSGDRNPNDRRLQTFNALFPKGKYFGELSPVGPYNIINGHAGVDFDLGHGVGLGIAGMAYWRESTGDGIYDIPGNLIRGPNGSRARFIGKQAEAVVSWQATPEWALSASLSAFEPGAFIRETGPSRTIRMIGLESNFRF